MQYLIRGLIFSIFFYINTALVSIIIILTLPFPSCVSRKIAKYWSYINLLLLRLICNIKYEIKGLENLPKDKHYIIACKHQSAWETVTLHQFFAPLVFLFKKELAYIPFFGLALFKTGAIAVDRGNGNKAMIKKLEQLFKLRLKHSNIIIFPEGTRSLPNSQPNYKSGISLITKNLQNELVIPIALNSGLFWPKKGFKKYPGTIKVSILPAIQTGLLSVSEFQDKLVTSIENEMKNL